MTDDQSSPRVAYQERRDRIREVGVRVHRAHIQLGNVRLALVILTLIVFFVGKAPTWTLIFPVAAFLALSVVHEHVIRRLTQLRRTFHVYELALARIDNRWQGRGRTGQRYLDTNHPFAEDLDLFGKGSLFERLSIARTRAGEETLAHWLCKSAAPDVIRARQEAVRELAPLLDLREQIAVLGEEVKTGVHARELAAWGRLPSGPPNGRLRSLTAALVGLQITAFTLWCFNVNLIGGMREGVGSVVPVFLIGLAQWAVWFSRRKEIKHIVHAVELPGRELRILSELLGLLERQEFRSPLLKGLTAELKSGGIPPSRQIARLNRLIDILNDREHLLLRIIGPPLMWTMQAALAVEDWRRRHGKSVGRWLSIVGEFEALSSLAAYAFENPQDVFPEICDEGPLFEAHALAHPLLPPDKAVRNDITLGGGVRLLIVSGSNMSGKTTLLRAVGVNAVLASAGAPVRANHLRISPLKIGACIRVHDSLQEGKSRFYWEIQRLKTIYDEALSGPPLLFLFDELLHGTNSHDRKIGSERLLRGFTERGSIGLVTTHDLALTDIVPALDGRAANVHFEDRLENGQIAFDYRMRPGVVQKTNALQLMRSIGLDV